MEALSRGGLVLDGAMGSALLAAGTAGGACLEEICVTHPGRVSDVHAAHLRAGARVLTTHSFGANRLRLAPHGLSARAAGLAAAAARLARRAAGDAAFVVGSVGPGGQRPGDGAAVDQEALYQVFAEPCAALVQAGVDGLLLETFQQPLELQVALRAARAAAAGRIAVLVCVSVDAAGTLADGSAPRLVAQRLAEWGADAIGVNCVAVEVIAPLLAGMGDVGLPLVARPNAGQPTRRDGHLFYPTTPEVFGEQARALFLDGVGAVGGCCGTTAAHVRAVARAASAAGGARRPAPAAAMGEGA